MGLLAYVCRTGRISDCSNGGVSAKFDEVTIVNVEGPYDPTPTAPAVMLVPGAFAGTALVVPYHKPEGYVGPMMGGTYVATSDSRFSSAVERLTGHPFYGAVPFHDRFETQEQYDANFD